MFWLKPDRCPQPRSSSPLTAHLLALVLLGLLSPLPVWAQATLENPAAESFQSGIGLISGWACEAEIIEVAFDGGAPVEAAYGSSRGDTHGACGDTDNGFGLTFNWNLLGDGPHTVVARTDGVEFARVTVTVATLGTEFLQNVSEEVTVADFPRLGTDIQLRWQEAQQNFVITDGSSGGGGGTRGTATAVLENPAPGSFQSGIGLISGWACEADIIEVAFDDGAPVEAAYGSSRGDTHGVCGDTDNGFGLTFNWNLLGDGPHTVVARADGVEFARVTVTVATLGTEFLQDAHADVTVPDFPAVGTDVLLRWQAAQQNFVIASAHTPKLYWVDHNNRRIQRANLDGSQIETVFAGVLQKQKYLRIDEAGGKLYWISSRGISGEDMSYLMRANLNGSELEILATYRKGFGGTLSACAIDAAGRKLYWTERDLNNVGWTLSRSALDGSNPERLFTDLAPLFGPIAVAEGYVYHWYESGDSRVSYIERLRISDGTRERIIEDVGIRVISDTAAMDIDEVGRKLYWVERSSGRVRRANLDGSQVEVVSTGYQRPEHIAIDAAGRKMIWSDRESERVYRANLDGSGLEVFSQGVRVQGLAYHGAEGAAYLVLTPPPLTVETSIARTTHRDMLSAGIITPFAFSRLGGYQLVIDVPRKRMYWPGEVQADWVTQEYQHSAGRTLIATLHTASTEDTVVGSAQTAIYEPTRDTGARHLIEDLHLNTIEDTLEWRERYRTRRIETDRWANETRWISAPLPAGSGREAPQRRGTVEYRGHYYRFELAHDLGIDLVAIDPQGARVEVRRTDIPGGYFCFRGVCDPFLDTEDVGFDFHADQLYTFDDGQLLVGAPDDLRLPVQTVPGSIIGILNFTIDPLAGQLYYWINVGRESIQLISQQMGGGPQTAQCIAGFDRRQDAPAPYICTPEGEEPWDGDFASLLAHLPRSFPREKNMINTRHFPGAWRTTYFLEAE